MKEYVGIYIKIQRTPVFPKKYSEKKTMETRIIKTFFF